MTALIIHTSMSLEFQKQYKTMDAYSIVCHLREHYNEQTSIERFKVSRLLFGSKMEVGTSPVQYALKMYNHIERLNQLGYLIVVEFSTDLILARLLLIDQTIPTKSSTQLPEANVSSPATTPKTC